MPQDYVTDANGNLRLLPSRTVTTTPTPPAPVNTPDTSNTPILNSEGEGLNDGPWNIAYDAAEIPPVPDNSSNATLASTPPQGRSININDKTKQQGLYDKGYDLGNTGTNKDGVDGDWGPKSKAAADADANLKKQAATDWGIKEDDLEWIPGENKPDGYGTNHGNYKPVDGAKSSYGDTYNSETAMFEDENYAYDAEGNAVSLEEFNALYGETNDDTSEKKKTDDKKENLKWYQKIGVNNITDLIEAAAIMKTNKMSHDRLNELKSLNVRSKKTTPIGVSLERTDLGSEKKKIQQLGLAAITQAMDAGKSVAEIQALKVGTAEALRDVGATEDNINREIRNTEKLENRNSRIRADEFNLTNERKDQVENNEIQAAALQGSIAVYNQMRDAISTKITDAKLLMSAEKQMKVFANAIAGGTGLDERKLMPAIQYMLGQGHITQAQASSMKTDLQKLDKKE